MATGCISLAGSALCPAYGSLSINATALASSWPLFRTVTNVTTFDTAFSDYLAADGQFAKTKQYTQLGCSGYQSGFVLQYSQSFLCGEFTTLSYSTGCNAAAGANVSASMTCQSTCYQFADSELNLVNDTLICPAASNSTRESQLTKDFTSCTDWTTLATNDTATCVMGDTNEGNCGFRSSTGQLCAYCNPDTGLVNPCCIASNTNLTTCGYSLTADEVYTTPTSGPTSAGAQPTSATGGSAPTSTGHHSISKGAIAGAVIGSVLGALILLILLLLLLRACRRRRNERGLSPEGIEGGPMMRENSPQSHYYNQQPEKTPGGGTTATSSTFGHTPVFPSRPQPAKTTSPSPNHMGANAGLLAGAAAGAGAAGLYGAYGGGEGGSRTPSLAQESLSHKSTITGEGGRILVPAFQDLYSDQVILPGSHVVVLYAYKATLGDELSLSVGESIQVINLYDDDWASGRVIDAEGNTLAQGAFPLVCVSLVGGDTTTTTSPESSGEEVDIPQRGEESAGAGYQTATTADEYATAAEDNDGFLTADESDVPRRRP